MNEQIKELAIEANLISPELNGFDPTHLSISQQKFAELVAEKEREACATICEQLPLPEWPNKIRQPLAQAIRARGYEK
jgi:hypothetical protein